MLDSPISSGLQVGILPLDRQPADNRQDQRTGYHAPAKLLLRSRLHFGGVTSPDQVICFVSTIKHYRRALQNTDIQL